ncbi:hypothetical protein Pa4123_60070 [Phytohabitans aurantiacus]|uniref:Uncharacterized protein n=1 Tax=Phytohabitans aurantiacus TaxID=3016789 RepID=A0ABQ5R2E8_9ACTN|nr:hypothetical protein Pa4123_60070 [Phytohabitans aurantiacus]
MRWVAGVAWRAAAAGSAWVRAAVAWVRWTVARRVAGLGLAAGWLVSLACAVVWE